MIEYDFKQEVIKLTPAAGVATTSVMGIPLQDWVYIATIFYLMVQVVALCFKIRIQVQQQKQNKEVKDGSEEAVSEETGSA
ncbi:hypothetical protein B0T49_12770 [Chromobacterium violaceum]|uniref:hypothetical protein n=1 Tax=Chromobacterium violaceum TaxID=536 RepID=UPI0009DA1857|nr:hypothetical protein [Chromobacterium violaceum]OQS47809.1 hypothetical protein B0T48_12055 [Chromobacterium violaceum]OQS49939.1 hypothetical protein B0T49_12770 [Chromobacterium violaceum]